MVEPVHPPERPSVTSADHDETRALLIIAQNRACLEYFDHVVAEVARQSSACLRICVALAGIVDKLETERAAADLDWRLNGSVRSDGMAAAYEDAIAVVEKWIGDALEP